LDQAFKHAKRRGPSLALLYIDLDGFKAVNDTLLLPEHATSPDELLRAADQAMYQVKRATGNRFCFSGAPHQETAATD